MKTRSLIALGLTTLSVPAFGASLLTGGHMDAPAFGYVSGEGFEPHLHNEGGPDGSIIDGVRQEDESEYEPDEITIVIPFTSTTSLDSQSYYWLPEDEIDAANNGVAFLGIGLEELDPDDWDGNVTISLSGLTGMGDFLLWRSGAFGDPETVLDSSNLGHSFELAPGSHTHCNWGFTEVGLYELDFTIAGIHKTDGFQTATGTFNFEMIPEPSTALLGGLGLLALFRRRR